MIDVRNPKIEELEFFAAFRNPLNAEARAKRMAESIQQGTATLTKHWICSENNVILAVWSLIASDTMVLCRSLDNISNSCASAILESLETNTPSSKLILKRSSSRLFDDIALARGWSLQERSIHYLTFLQNRQDLHSDGQVKSFDLEELNSEQFQDFFLALNSEQSRSEIHERFTDYENTSVQILIENNQFIAAGVMGFVRDTIAMDIIGVLPRKRRQGLGTRLHQHMMWISRALGNNYVGMTDAENLPMLKIFESNRCLRNDEQVSLIFK